MSVPGSQYSNYFGNNWEQNLGVEGGWNPSRPIQRKTETGLGIRALAQTAFGNSLEPQRQAAIKGLMALLNPANIAGRVNSFAKGANSRAFESGQTGDTLLQSLGLGSGAREGSALAGVNTANRQANQFANSLYSNQGQTDAFGGLLQAIGAGQNTDLAQIVARLSALMEQQNKSAGIGVPGQGMLGGLLGGIGQLAGMGSFNNLGSLFGGGNNGSVTSNNGIIEGWVV